MPTPLPAGAKAPAFHLHAVNSDEVVSQLSQDQRLVLLFFPADPSAGLVEMLRKYQETLPSFAEQNASVIGLSPASADQLRALALDQGLSYPLAPVSDFQLLRDYAVVSEAGEVEPAAYLLDEGSVRGAYEAERYPELPNPPIVARAARKLNTVLRPSPVSPEDWQHGPADAPVVLIEYSDYQCPHCIHLYAAVKAVEARFPGKILSVHRHLPLRVTHPLAQLAAEAAEASGAQGRFWEMHERLFLADCALEREQLIGYARELGLDMERFTAELDDRAHQEAVNDDFKLAVKLGIKLPPTLFINGVLYEGPRTEAELGARVSALLA